MFLYIFALDKTRTIFANHLDNIRKFFDNKKTHC